MNISTWCDVARARASGESRPTRWTLNIIIIIIIIIINIIDSYYYK